MLIVCPSCASSYSLTAEQLGAGRKLRCASCRHQWLATPEDALPEPGDGPVPVVAPDPEPIPEIPAVAATSADDPGETAAPPPPDEPAMSGSAGKSGFLGKFAFLARFGSLAKSALPRKSGKPERARRGARPGVPAKERLAGVAARVRRLPPAAAAVLVLAVLAGAAVAERKPIVRMLPQTAKLFAAIGLPVNLRGLAIEGVKSELVADAAQTILVVEGTVRAVAPGAVEVPPLQLSIRGADGQEVYSWTAEVPATALQRGETAPFRARLVAPPAEGRDVVVRFAARESHTATH